MQISDMLNQYNRNISNGTEISGGTQGIRQVMSSLQNMPVGNVFEGSVNHMENGVVTLGLPDGKTIQAKLDSGVSVRVGESMFFQVRSNNGAQIAIRPFSNGTGANPTLLNALKAANLPVNGKTVTMVNAMMEQAMSIDKQSLLHMAKLVLGNDGMDAASIVQMAKLGIPITEEMAAQFENYKFDQYAILDQLEAVLEMLPENLSGKGMGEEKFLEFNQKMLELFLGEEAAGDGGSVKVLPEASVADGKVVANLPEQAEGQPQEAADAKTAVLKPDLALAEETLAELESPEKSGSSVSEKTAETASVRDGNAPENSQNAAKPQAEMMKSFLSGGELSQLAKQMTDILKLSANPELFQKGILNGDVTSKELMQLLSEAFLSQDPDVNKALGGLASSKAYRALVRNMIERQWFLKPEELKTEHKVGELYERMDRQLGQMEKILKAFGQNAPQLSETASAVRSNIQFMNQLNQVYAYVQIPLKLAGQNAQSELYVYADKRKKQEKDGELTAFLHLDLDHLGATDVSIKLAQKKVATNFYLADDASYQIILENMHILEKRLEEKGYNVRIQVTNQEEKANFVEELLKKGTPSAGGMVHRYSFDVRA